MPHVDEGILHAYLDGALDALHEDGALPDAMTPADVLTHLDACADCRARLGIERDIRERAGEVLRHAAPIINTPPIESLRTPRRAAPWVPYAWAASVVMAVGAGWWGSQVSRQMDAPQMAAETQSAVQDRSAPTDAILPQAASAPLAESGTQPPTATVGAAAQSDAQVSGFGAEAEKTVAAVTPPAAARETTVAADNQQARIAGVQSQQAQLRPQAFDTIAANRQTRDLTARVTVPMAAPAPPSPPATPATPLDRFLNALNLMRAQGFAWRTATSGDSVVAFGITDATSTQIEIAVAPDIGDVVRVRQRLPDGRDIALVQWRQMMAAAAPAREETRAANVADGIMAARTLDDGTAQVVVQPAPHNTLVAILVVGTDAVFLARRLAIISR